MIVFTCQRHQKHLRLATRTQALVMVMVWADVRPKLVFIDRSRILSRKYAGGCIEAMGTQTVRSQTLDTPIGLSTTALSTRHQRMLKKQKKINSRASPVFPQACLCKRVVLVVFVASVHARAFWKALFTR